MLFLTIYIRFWSALCSVKVFPKDGDIWYWNFMMTIVDVPVTDYEMTSIRIYGHRWNQCELFFVDKASSTGTILSPELLQLWLKGTAFFVMNCFSPKFCVFSVKSVMDPGRSVQGKFFPPISCFFVESLEKIWVGKQQIGQCPPTPPNRNSFGK